MRLYLLMMWTLWLPMAYCHIIRRISVGSLDSNGLLIWVMRGRTHTGCSEAGSKSGRASIRCVSTMDLEHVGADYLDSPVADVIESTLESSLCETSSF
jgi:hypothetical protein